MCRWLAYSGPPIFLDRLILKPENSLIHQSRRALQSTTAINGDGFGVGWYAEREKPGLFRDILPAWNDENLSSLSAQIRSRLFFAHVRASTGTQTSRANCHPFRHGRWLFMHNGKIGGFERVRRDLAVRVCPDLFGDIQGTTDSELFFYLALSNGLIEDPLGSLARSVGEVLEAMAKASVVEPLTLTAAVTDGSAVYALRYASRGRAPSLFYGCGARPHRPDGSIVDGTPPAVLILSEPLDHDRDQWTEVPEAHVLVAGDGGLGVHPFEPLAARPPAA